MRIIIDIEACTQDGLCEDICPGVFDVSHHEVSLVDGTGARIGPQGDVDDVWAQDVDEAVGRCPAECIQVA